MAEWKQEIRGRLSSLQLAPMREAAIVEELAQHLEDCYEGLLARGTKPAEAERLTLAELSESELLARELRRIERVVLRTSGDDAKELRPLVRTTARALEPAVRLWLDTPEEEIANSKWGFSGTRIASQLATALGLLALLLAAIGLHGVMAYSVSQRKREIGIRMALGANRGTVLRLVLGQSLRLIMIGLALGVAGSAIASRLLLSLLYGLSPFDPIAYVGVSLLLVAVALVATFVPARRATKVDPMVALRYE